MSFYRNKKVLVTGHTGFKGSWLCKILINLGAEVTGYALAPPPSENLFDISQIEGQMHSVIGDIRNFEKLYDCFHGAKLEIAFHLAAQPIVRESYRNPRYTFDTNVMGTVNILECVRQSGSMRSFLNVTTDKVYKNNEWEWGYRENEPLDGFDPYSNSKSCSELVTHSYKNSFFADNRVAVSTARAGNVIGGGDFSPDRIIPDCVRAAKNGEAIIVRNARSTRPYQHVLEPLFAYLLIAQKQYADATYADYYNVGPDECDCINTGDLARLFCDKWARGQTWKNIEEANAPHEASFLKLDCSKIKAKLHWAPCWNVQKAVEKTVEWTKCYFDGQNIPECMDKQILDFLREGQYACFI